MRPTPYWIGQALFLLVFAALFDRMTDLMILGLAAIQFVLMAGRLWDARRPAWLAAAPPVLTVGWWIAGMLWAVRVSGDGQGAGLIVALSTAVICLASYALMAIGAGCLAPRRASINVERRPAHAWAPPWQMRHP